MTQAARPAARSTSRRKLTLRCCRSRSRRQFSARNEGLGFLGLAFAFAATLAFAVVVTREALGLARLAAIEKLHLRAAAVLLSDDRSESQAIVQDLLRLEHQNPQ